MARVGVDFRSHGLSAGTTINDANIGSFAYSGATLDTTVTGTGTITAQGTGIARFADPDASSSAYVETVTALTGDKFSGMILLDACPTPTGNYRMWQIRNAANSADALRLMLNASRSFHIENSAGTVIAGPSAAVGTGAAVRVNLSGDFSAQTARLDVWTTNPATNAGAADWSSGALTARNWNSETGIGRSRVGAPHSSAVSGNVDMAYAVLDDSTEAVLAPLTATLTAGTETTVAASTISGVTGGTGPYSIVGATQTAGTSIGTLTFTGLTVWGAQLNVNEVTLNVTVEDSLGGQVVQAVTIPAPSGGGGGEFLWDLAKVGGAGFVGFGG